MTLHRAIAIVASVLVLMVPAVEPWFASPGQATGLPGPALQTPAQLRLPDSAFTPATLSSDKVETNDEADASWFGIAAPPPPFHSKTYASMGRVSGYYQQASISSGSSTVTFFYLGGVFRDAPSAAAAMQDGSDTAFRLITSGGSRQDCSGFTGTPCAFLTGAGSALTAGGFSYYIIQVDQCLGEISASYPNSILAGNSGLVSTTLNNVRDAAAQLLKSVCAPANPVPPATTPSSPPTQPPAPTRTPTPRPTSTPTATAIPTAVATSAPAPTTGPPPTVAQAPTQTNPQPTPAGTSTSQTEFTVVSARVEKPKAAPDFSSTGASLARVKAGAKVALAIYVQAPGAAQNTLVTYDYTVTRGKTTAQHKLAFGNLGGSAAGQYRGTATVSFKTPGSYTFTGRATLHGKSDEKSVSFSVTK